VCVDGFRRKAILLVEDSDDDVLLFERAFKLARFTNSITRVSTAEEAIAYLKGEGKYADRAAFPLPFTIMLDMRLPGASGMDVLKWIRSQPQFDGTLVFVLSGSTLNSSRRETLESGADSFLNKPCKADDLRRLAQNFPHGWQTRSA
jgi:CheY-like chemotaxis protein